MTWSSGKPSKKRQRFTSKAAFAVKFTVKRVKRKMRKVVFAVNMTTDGYCNHADMMADYDFSLQLHNLGKPKRAIFA
jgi:hypothetical protein